MGSFNPETDRQTQRIRKGLGEKTLSVATTALRVQILLCFARSTDRAQQRF
jgi:hypothetical protein